MERTPGLFQIGLNASQGPSSKQLHQRIEVVYKLQRDIPGCFTYCAASNLLGVFLYYDKRLGEAISVFKQVLSLDKENVNAVANLIFVFKRLQTTQFAKEYEAQYADMYNHMTSKTKAVFLAEQGFAFKFDCYLQKDQMDRCQQSIDLFHESLNCLGKIEDSDFPDTLLIGIQSWLIQCLQKKCDASVRIGPEKVYESYKEGIQLIKRVIESDPIPADKLNVEPIEEGTVDTIENVGDQHKEETTDTIENSGNSLLNKEKEGTAIAIENAGDTLLDQRKEEMSRTVGTSHHVNLESAVISYRNLLCFQRCDCDQGLYWIVMAYTYLGIFLFKNPNNYWNEDGVLVRSDKIPEVVTDCNLEAYFGNPASCFDKGLEIMDLIQCSNEYHNTSSELLIRYALFLRNNTESLEKAYDLLDQALENDRSNGNWFALTIRAQVNFKRAEQLHKESDTDKAKEVLQHAIEDATKALSINSTAMDLCRLANIYSFKADNFDCPDTKVISHMKASEYFLHAVESIGEAKLPEIHRMHGHFLKSLGEERQAIECFKRGIASDTSHKETLSFKLLFETFLEMFKRQKAEDIVSSDNLPNDDEDDRGSAERNTTKSKTILAKTKQNVLYEMIYWFKFAFHRYSKKKDQETKQRRRSAVDLEKIAKTFVLKYKQEMADVAAYFEVVLSNQEISQFIADASENDSEWPDIFENAKSKLQEKHPHATKRNIPNSCPTCGSTALPRQESFPPEPTEKSRNGEYKYDFYIIYNQQDGDWVLYDLLTGLEATYGFKGAIPNRDFLPGSKTVDEINRILDQSFKVLLILTEHFNKDPFNTFERSLALSKQLLTENKRSDSYVIPIVRKKCEIPPELRLVHVLDAVDDFDWGKLVSSLTSID